MHTPRHTKYTASNPLRLPLILRIIFKGHIILAGALPAMAGPITSGGVIELRGPITGGGGRAIVCEQYGAISSVELLDIFEGREAFAEQHFAKDAKTEDEFLELAVSRLEGTAYNMWGNFKRVRESVEKTKAAFHIMNDGTIIQPIDDSFEAVAPANCQIRQIARYLDAGRIIVDGTLYAKLHPLDRAALTLHEALYATDRSLTGIQDSRHARRAVSQALEVDSKIGSTLGYIPQNATFCQSLEDDALTFFAAYKDPSTPDRFVSVRIIAFNGELMTDKLEGFLLDETEASDLFTRNNPTADIHSSIMFGETPRFELDLHKAGGVLRISGSKLAWPQYSVPEPGIQLLCR